MGQSRPRCRLVQPGTGKVSAMTPPNATGGAPPTAGNQRTVGSLLLGIAVILLVSSVAWFGNGQAGVGLAQIERGTGDR